jgi:hypothetical protein
LIKDSKYYLLSCNNGSRQSFTNNIQVNDFYIVLKLNGINSLDLINNEEFRESIKVYSFDLSQNQNDLQNYLNNLSQFGENLIELNLSYNKISRLFTKQFT